MFWRVLIGIGAFTFFAAGADVLSGECESVSFGGSGRALNYSCAPAGEGGLPSGVAGAGMIVISLVMFGLACWPLIGARLMESRVMSPS